jgi:hypothetical protein
MADRLVQLVSHVNGGLAWFVSCQDQLQINGGGTGNFVGAAGKRGYVED